MARLPRVGISLVAGAGLLAMGLASTAPVAAAGPAGVYFPITPCRIADTRAGSLENYAGDTLAPGGMLQVQVEGDGGGCGVPASTDVTAVVLNVTAVDPTTAGFLTVLPGTETLPTGSGLVSNLNFNAGQTVANLVTVGLNTSTGTVEVYNYAGTTDVVVDVAGYYATTALWVDGVLYNPMSPTRVLGTLAIGQAIRPNSATPVQVAGGSTGVPSTATAVVVNVTAAWATLPSFLTVYPALPTLLGKPWASNLNFGKQAPLQAIANRVTVGVSTDGYIDVYNLQGTVNVDVDVDGYYDSTGSQFVAITPQRLTDTRSAVNGSSIAASTSETFALNATTSAGTIPTNAAAVAANFTVVPGADPGYLTVYPVSDTTNPVASDVNWTASESPGVPNFTVADTASTGNVAVFNSHGATINLLIDAFGYFTQNTTVPTMVSAIVTNAAITITYNEPVSCAAAAAADFAYSYNGALTGGTATGCSAGSEVLTLTTGSAGFTLPAPTGAEITYTAPATETTANSVYALSNATAFAETPQTLSTTSVTTGVVPTMVSAVWTSNTTILITYNEGVTCTGAYADFAYDYTTGTSGGTVTSCTVSGDVLTLGATGGFTAPASGASIVYTAPATNSTTLSLYANSGSATVYAATQTLSGSMWATPTITAATVTPGAYGTGTIAVTYNEPVSCPTGLGNAQTLFAYSNGGTAAYPSGCANTSTDVITLAEFYGANTGTTPAVTLVAPVATDTLVYTAPATNSTVVSVNSTDFPQFPATQTFPMLLGIVPTMKSAVVTNATITITFNEAVSCPTTFTDDWVYNSTTVPSAIVGGTVTSCAAAGDVLTLSATGGFNAATGTANIVYAQGAPTTANAVYSTVNPLVFEAGETLPGSDIT